MQQSWGLGVGWYMGGRHAGGGLAWGRGITEAGLLVEANVCDCNVVSARMMGESVEPTRG
jgi:hypothetical protein